MIRLINHSKVPPGEYWYRDPNRTKRFGPTPEIRELAKEISAFRRGNNYARSSVGECLEDIDLFTCARLPAGNEWCYDTDRDYQATIQASAGHVGGCSTCGARVS